MYSRAITEGINKGKRLLAKQASELFDKKKTEEQEHDILLKNITASRDGFFKIAEAMKELINDMRATPNMRVSAHCYNGHNSTISYDKIKSTPIDSSFPKELRINIFSGIEGQLDWGLNPLINDHNFINITIDTRTRKFELLCHESFCLHKLGKFTDINTKNDCGWFNDRIEIKGPFNPNNIDAIMTTITAGMICEKWIAPTREHNKPKKQATETLHK